MKPRLILINGNPGMGKSTLAERYAGEHPLTLNLDIDRVWHMMGQWQSELAESSRLKYLHAYALADSHLRAGYDVIVPDLMETTEHHEQFERIARANNARFHEFVLLSDENDAIERCKARGRRMGYIDGFRPNGVLDNHGRELRLQEMHANLLAATALRENAIIIYPALEDIEGTYQHLISECETTS